MTPLPGETGQVEASWKHLSTAKSRGVVLRNHRYPFTDQPMGSVSRPIHNIGPQERRMKLYQIAVRMARVGHAGYASGRPWRMRFGMSAKEAL